MVCASQTIYLALGGRRSATFTGCDDDGCGCEDVGGRGSSRPAYGIWRAEAAGCVTA